MRDYKYLLAAAAVIIFGSVLAFQKPEVNVVVQVPEQSGETNLGSAFDIPDTSINLFGSSSNLVSLPFVGVEANSTTTDETNAVNQLADGGDTINQYITTDGIRKVVLAMATLHGTATSTLYMKQMGSFDNSNWYNIMSASSTGPVGTTTLPTTPRAFELNRDDTGTTTRAFEFDTFGYRFTRFIFWADDLNTDPTDGVQAWVEVSKIREVTR